MASPTVSNITLLSASNANAWSSTTVGNANAAIADLAVSQSGINAPNTCSTFENSSSGTTSGNKYSALSPSWSAVDISGANQCILFHFAGNPGQFNRVSTASDGITAYVFDSGGSRTTNYRRWELGGSNAGFYKGPPTFYPILLFSAGATAETGTLDESQIVEMGIAWKAADTGQFGVDFRIDQILYINGEVVFADGDVTTPGTWKRYRDLIWAEAATGTVYNAANVYLPIAYGFGYPIRMNCARFEDSNFTFIFLPVDSDKAFNPPTTGYYSLSIDPSSSSAYHSYTDGTFAFASGTYPLDIDSSSLTTGSLNFTRCTWLNVGAASIIGANTVMTACTITSPASITIASGDLDLSINSSTAAIQWTADLVAGSTITTNSDIDITFAGTNLDDINLVLTGALTISVDPTGASQTYYLGGITTSSTLKLWNKDTSNATTIEIPAGITTQKIDLWFNYDTELNGPFIVGEPLTFGNGATATLRTLVDNGTSGTMYCTYIAGTTPPDNNSITGGTSSATAAVNEATGAKKSTLTITQTPVTYTFNSDTASTLIRYFEDGSQTVVDSVTGTTLDYDFPDADPVDVEFVKQGYVPVNRQNVTPTDGGTLDIIMDVDEAYNASHGLTITSQYDYNRSTKVLTINSDQEALDVRSALADVIRTNSAYYNTALLMVAIPGLTRIDLTNGMTITSMATWKGAGMERFDAADSTNPVEKWVAIKSVGNITGASAYYRQTSSGNATAVSLTSNVVNEAFQYWSDPNHDGSTADGYDRSGYFVIKTFLAGTRQARADVVASSGLAALKSNLYTISLANLTHDYAGTDPGISADLTLIAGGTVGGVVFAYEWVDGGTNTGADIADQLHYNRITTPNSVIPGGTGLRWWELPDMVIYNATSVETEKGYREGATPTVVGFYVSRGGADHPDFTRFEGDNGTYYTPPVTANATGTNLPDDVGGDTRLQILNLTALTAPAWQASTAYSAGDLVLRTTGTGSESTAGLFFRCTTAGTSGGSEPTWVTTTAGIFGTPGSSTTDNTVTWQCFAILLYDADPASTGWSDTYTDGYEFASGETARIAFAHMNGSTSFELGRTTAAVTADGFSFDASLFVEADSVFAVNGIDGSTRTEFTADYTDTEIDVSSDTDSSPENAFAWYCYNLTTSTGMYRFWNAVTAIDTANYRNNTAVASIKFDNTTTGSVSLQGTGARFFRDDLANPVKDPTTSGYGVALTWELPVYAYDGGGGGFTAGDRADLTSIKGKTDSLTFTVSNKVDANTQYINDAQVQGDGSSGDKWRGV